MLPTMQLNFFLSSNSRKSPSTTLTRLLNLILRLFASFGSSSTAVTCPAPSERSLEVSRPSPAPISRTDFERTPACSASNLRTDSSAMKCCPSLERIWFTSLRENFRRIMLDCNRVLGLRDQPLARVAQDGVGIYRAGVEKLPKGGGKREARVEHPHKPPFGERQGKVGFHHVLEKLAREFLSKLGRRLE